MSLTNGAVRQLAAFEGLQSDPSFSPTVQIVQVKRVSSPSGAASDRYRTILSDGEHFVQGMLATQLNHLVDSNRIKDNTIIKIRDFMTNLVHGRTIVILLGFDILNVNFGSKIGNPQDVDTAGAAPPHTSLAPQPDIDDFGDEDGKDDVLLSWRLDGPDSFSDWTIVVNRTCSEDVEKSATAETYHVHKNILAVGPRKSEYFAALFRNRHVLAESSTLTTTVDLEDTAADAFPVMLDYIYEEKNGIAVKNAVAVRHLARYFRVRSLFHAATHIIRENWFFEDVADTFLLEASKYHDEKLVESSIRLCAEEIRDCGVERLNDYSPVLFKRIITSKHLNCDSEYLSDVVAGFYCHDCRDRNDKELLDIFDILTDEKIMPTVGADFAAFWLLQWDAACQKSNPNRNNTVRDRCLDAISSKWQDTIGDFLDKEAKRKAGQEISDRDKRCHEMRAIEYQNLDASVQKELLERALGRAHLDMLEKEREIKRLKRRGA